MDTKNPMMNNEPADELDSIIVLTDEEGNDVQFEFLDLVQYQDAEYVVLLPADEDADEVVILKVALDPEDEETETYVSVEDDATLAAVFKIFQERFKDEFDFAD